MARGSLTAGLLLRLSLQTDRQRSNKTVLTILLFIENMIKHRIKLLYVKDIITSWGCLLAQLLTD